MPHGLERGAYIWLEYTHASTSTTRETREKTGRVPKRNTSDALRAFAADVSCSEVTMRNDSRGARAPRNCDFKKDGEGSIVVDPSKGDLEDNTTPPAGSRSVRLAGDLLRLVAPSDLCVYVHVCIFTCV